MAFKKSKQQSQPDLFATASFSLPERERRYMDDELSWHNEFRRNVLMNIDEEILRPLFVEESRGQVIGLFRKKESMTDLSP